MSVSSLRIRAMTMADVPASSALARAQGFRDRTGLYAFVLRVPTCIPLVGTVDGQLVATAVGTANRPIGWLGGIIVDEGFRRRGFGRTMTEELVGRLRAAGCHTLSLESTEQGRPLYLRLGFRDFCDYIEFDATGGMPRPRTPRGARLRPILVADLPSVFALDRAATGEDRHLELGMLVESTGGWLIEDDSGLPEGDEWAGPASSIRGFLVPSDRGHGAIVAPNEEDGVFLMRLHAFHGRTGPGPRCSTPDVRGPSFARRLSRGWIEHGRLPRMLLGPDPSWRPAWNWGQINTLMG